MNHNLDKAGKTSKVAIFTVRFENFELGLSFCSLETDGDHYYGNTPVS